MRTRGFLPALFAAVVALPAAAQEPVARVKSAPQDYRGRSVELQGEVVEIQALSPRSRQGIYRLLDGSDPAGVLIRTDDLPQTGGPFRVRAALSPELLRNGQLLLDEASRQTLGTGSLPIALGLAGVGLAAVLWSAGAYLAARRRERRMHLAPPLWLIPATGEQPADAQSHAPAKFDYKLQYVEEERSAQIEGRKRRALLALGPGLLVAIAGAAWAGVVLRAEASQPSFVLLEPDSGDRAAAPGPSDSAASRPDDTLRVVVQQPPPAAMPPVVPDTMRRRRPRRDTAVTAQATPPPAAPRDTARTAAVSASPETTVTAPVVPPPPAPEPERRAPEPERRPPEPAAPDPAELRRAAEAELQGGIARFAAAVAAREAGTVASLYPAGGDTRRVPFLDFIRDSRPEAALRGVEPATFTESTAQAQFTISFRWRGEFGVARRKDARFQANVRRTGSGWAFEGARLLEKLP